MARSRNIKPGLFKNEILGESDPIHTIMFAGLWTLADKRGRLEDRPKRIKAEIFPYRFDLDPCLSLAWLNDNSFINRYSVDDEKYIQIVSWNEHQSPHHKEIESIIPAFDESNKEHTKQQVIHAQSKHGSSMDQACFKEIASFPLIPDSLNLIPDAGYPIKSIGSSVDKPTQNKPNDYSEAFENAWKSYPNRAGANPKRRAYSAWSARLKAGDNAGAMLSGVSRYAEFIMATGKESTEFVMQTATFFGPDDHYLNDWAIPARNEHEAHQKSDRKLSAVDQAAAAAKRLTDRLDREQREVHGSIVGEDGVDLRS